MDEKEIAIHQQMKNIQWTAQRIWEITAPDGRTMYPDVRNSYLNIHHNAWEPKQDMKEFAIIRTNPCMEIGPYTHSRKKYQHDHRGWSPEADSTGYSAFFDINDHRGDHSG